MKVGEIWSRKKHVKNPSYPSVVIIVALMEKMTKKFGMTIIVHFRPYKVKVESKTVISGTPINEFVKLYGKDYTDESG